MNATLSAPSFYVDANALLGFGPPSPVPKRLPESGEMVIRYGGWSLLTLRAKHRLLFDEQDWYWKYPWAGEQLPSGLYALRLPIPHSKHASLEEQKKLLLPGEAPAHVMLAATALSALLVSREEDPLKGDWVRSGQQTDYGFPVALELCAGLLSVSAWWDDSRFPFVWLASARKL